MKLSDELVELAKPYAITEGRTISAQIEYRARLGKVAEENPDLPTPFLKNILRSLTEVNAGYLAEYKPETN